MARVVVHPIVGDMRVQHPTRELGQYVDDLKAFMQDKDMDVLCEEAVKLTNDLIDGVKSRALVVSGKTKVLASSRSLAHVVKATAAAKGVQVTIATAAPDLGADQSSGRRSVVTAKKRAGKAHCRDLKVIKLITKRPRVRLFNTAVMPQLIYGAECQGVAPTVLQRWRAMAARHAGAKAGWCATTVLALDQAAKDPVQLVQKQVVLSFVRLWCEHPELWNDIRAAWNQMVKNFAKVEPRYWWRQVKGPLAAAWATLSGLGWTADWPFRCIAPDGAA